MPPSFDLVLRRMLLSTVVLLALAIGLPVGCTALFERQARRLDALVDRGTPVTAVLSRDDDESDWQASYKVGGETYASSINASDVEGIERGKRIPPRRAHRRSDGHRRRRSRPSGTKGQGDAHVGAEARRRAALVLRLRRRAQRLAISTREAHRPHRAPRSWCLSRAPSSLGPLDRAAHRADLRPSLARRPRPRRVAVARAPGRRAHVGHPRRHGLVRTARRPREDQRA
jgi:hypothetical protein